MLLLAVAKALINLSSGNAAAKESIVNEGGVRSLLPHLLTKTEELTRAFCVLLKVRAPPATPPSPHTHTSLTPPSSLLPPPSLALLTHPLTLALTPAHPHPPFHRHTPPPPRDTRTCSQPPSLLALLLSELPDGGRPARAHRQRRRGAPPRAAAAQDGDPRRAALGGRRGGGGVGRVEHLGARGRKGAGGCTPPSPGPSYPLPLARIALGLPVHRCVSVGCSCPSLPLDGRAAQVIKEHGVEALTEQLQTSTSEDVWQKCAGCLMVLAANSDKVKNLIGEQMGVRALTAIVKQSTTNPPVLKATLGALAVLSSDERNLAYMREEGMEQLIEKFKVKDDRVQMFVKQLKERLYNAETQ